MADLVYIEDGFWTRFAPVTDAGDRAWSAMAAAYGNGCVAVPPHHVQSVMQQLRDAGYTVEKANPAPLDEIFAEMDTW
ncbi:hypothetical protein [Pannonibacter tanglangensis]|uniref:Uncharacterized protein n=1 Tax=Pannonibacter tanglangensis TaxID=2750084 RepID=A0ABW9ZDH7_9HYPH|nr:hypothetical protein [Pannonibacter sp. XCT-34]NBN62062.1 hypothetical protein [Pannonibacter sp. XCT-34]